jgi:transcriptional regulator of acetoin/glycerol metabolism
MAPSACWCWARPTRRATAADMGTEFLQRIGEIASAALSRLLRRLK